jgi:uncharacterized protein (TIGR02466 family)
MTVQIFPLFSTPLYASEIIVDLVSLNFIKQLEFEPFVNSGYVTKDYYVLDHTSLFYIRKQIEGKIEEYLRDILKFSKDIDFNILNSWATKHMPMEYAPKHFHSNCLFSGVVYLQVEDESGDIIFTDSNCSPLYPRQLELNTDSYNIYNARSWVIRPRVGEILIFPSHLHHEVTINNSNTDRFVLAFNVFPKGILGKNSIAELKLI